MTSKTWLWILLFSGVLAPIATAVTVVGTHFYTITKEEEGRQKTKHNTLNFILIEISRTVVPLSQFKEIIDRGELPRKSLDLSIWQVILSSKISDILDSEQVVPILNVYQLMKDLNDLHSRAVDLSVGSSAKNYSSDVHYDDIMKVIPAKCLALQDSLSELASIIGAAAIENKRGLPK